MSNKKLLVFLTLSLLALGFGPEEAQAQAAGAAESVGLSMIGVGIAFAGGAIAAGFAIARAGSAGLAASAERPELRTTALIITALGEALAIYAIVVAFQMLGKIPGAA